MDLLWKNNGGDCMKDAIEYYLDSIEDMIDDDVDSFYQQVLEDVIL